MRFQVKKYREPITPIGYVAELFAGVGGFRIGLANSGWKTVFSNQWEPSTKHQHASDVYVKNFGNDGHTNIDIAKINKLPRKIDLLVGGFPCQDYSVAKSLNSAKGIKGKKGVLWWEIHRLIEASMPRFILLENVDRLLKSPSSQRGRDFAVMLKSLGELGYSVEWRVVNAAEFGFPQRRIRVFIVATLKKYQIVDNPLEIIENSGVLARALPIERISEKLEQIVLTDDIAKISSKFNKSKAKSPFRNSGYFTDDIAYSLNTLPRNPKNRFVLGDVLQENNSIDEAFWIDNSRIQEWTYHKGAKSITRTHKGSGTIYNYAEGKMAFPDLLQNPSRTILTAEGGSTPSRFKHIIKIGNRYRRLTPIELERLNGFPDNWTKFFANGEIVPDNRRAFFMGNALVIGIVEKIGKILSEDLKDKSN